MLSKENKEYAIKQGYNLKHDYRPEYVCQRCKQQTIFKELTLEDYPFYCVGCDENMYEFEISEVKK